MMKKITNLLNVNCDGTVQFNLELDKGEAHFIREALRNGRRIHFTYVRNKKFVKLGSVLSKVSKN